MTELDKRIYRAAARAAATTGVPILTHLAIDAENAIAILGEEGLPLDRVLFGHADDFRELDDRTTKGNPYHPHTRAVPVEPGKVDEPLADAHNALLPLDAFHLPVGWPVTHKIYREAAHPSRLVLPFTRKAEDK